MKIKIAERFWSGAKRFIAAIAGINLKQAKPDTKCIAGYLASECALLVHFSSSPKMTKRSPKAFYPADLRAVIDECVPQGEELSVAAIIPSDKYDLATRALPGCVGLILKLVGEESVGAINPVDGGTYDEGNEKISHCRDWAKDDLIRSITAIEGRVYNEWLVSGFEVIGIFVSEPAFVEDSSLFYGSMEESQEPINIATVQADFTGYSIYSFHNGGVARWEKGNWSPCSYDEIYIESE